MKIFVSLCMFVSLVFGGSQAFAQTPEPPEPTPAPTPVPAPSVTVSTVPPPPNWGEFEPTSYKNGKEEYSGYRPTITEQLPSCGESIQNVDHYQSDGAVITPAEILYITDFMCGLLGNDIVMEGVGINAEYGTYGIYDTTVYLDNGKVVLTMGPVWGNYAVEDKFWTVYEVESDLFDSEGAALKTETLAENVDVQGVSTWYDVAFWSEWEFAGREAFTTFVTSEQKTYAVEARASIFGTWWITEVYAL